MWTCRTLGHDVRFSAQGDTLSWRCARCCGSTGSKRYADAAAASRYARALNRRPSDRLGVRAPLIGLLPLRLWRQLRLRLGARPEPRPGDSARRA